MEQYYIIRCAEAGVFFGHIAERRGGEADLTDVRRIHYWVGAASLSQMAMEGIKNHASSRITVTVPRMTVLGVIEVIPCTVEAAKNILEAPVWKV